MLNVLLLQCIRVVCNPRIPLEQLSRRIVSKLNNVRTSIIKIVPLIAAPTYLIVWIRYCISKSKSFCNIWWLKLPVRLILLLVAELAVLM